MHTRSDSAPSSDYSLVSSLDALAISPDLSLPSSSAPLSTTASSSSSTSTTGASGSTSPGHDSRDNDHSRSRQTSYGSQRSSATGRTGSDDDEVIIFQSPQQRKSAAAAAAAAASSGSSLIACLADSTPTKSRAKDSTHAARDVNPETTPKKLVFQPRKTVRAGMGKGKATLQSKGQDTKVALSSASTAAVDGDRAPTTHKKTRRGGKRTRLRAERAQVRKVLELDDTDVVTGSIPVRGTLNSSSLSLSGNVSSSETRRVDDAVTTTSTGDTSFEDSEDGASRFLDEGDLLDDEDEVDNMSVLAGPTGSESPLPTPLRPKKTVRSSVMSTEDAKSSIDSFLNGDADFIGDKANKLRLWQALCIELGLVEMADDHPDLPLAPPSQATTIPQSAATRPTFPLPETLGQAQKVLKHAHINLADYIEARSSGNRDFAPLLYPSERSLKKYTSKEKKFVALPTVKEEWLNPLLKDFGFKHSRGAKGEL